MPSALTFGVGAILALFIVCVAILFAREVAHIVSSLQSKDQHHFSSGLQAVALWVFVGLPAVAFSIWMVIQMVAGHAMVILK